MKELFNLVDKYGFTAPLVELPNDFDAKHFFNMCKLLNVTKTTIEVASQIFLHVNGIDERIASLAFIAEKTGRQKLNIRHHLKLLEEKGLTTTEFVTTDKVRKRRGTMFSLCLPKGQDIVEQATKTEEKPLERVPANVVGEPLSLSAIDNLFIELFVIRMLTKAMRTNRKDKRLEINVSVRDGAKAPVAIVSEAEKGRLMYVLDLGYYAACITWLIQTIGNLVKTKQQVTETYTIPLSTIIELSSKAEGSEATTGGASDNAINALRRISGTTFNLEKLPPQLISFIEFFEADLYFKLLRLEAVVTYLDGQGQQRKACRIQFPSSTVRNIEHSIREQKAIPELLMIDEQILTTKNEISMLFGLWARDNVINQRNLGQFYSWNELREHVAPSAELKEFKRKFSSMMLEHADPEYNVPKSQRPLTKGFSKERNFLVSFDERKEKVIEFGRALYQGLIISIGFSEEHGHAIISFRRSTGGLLIKSDIKYIHAGVNDKPL